LLIAVKLFALRCAMTKLALKFVTFPLVTFRFHVPVNLYGAGIAVVVGVLVVAAAVSALVELMAVVVFVVGVSALVELMAVVVFVVGVSALVELMAVVVFVVGVSALVELMAVVVFVGVTKDEIKPFAENVSSVVPIICANVNCTRLEQIDVKKTRTIKAVIPNAKKIVEK
jgi:hypothetical protein